MILIVVAEPMAKFLKNMPVRSYVMTWPVRIVIYDGILPRREKHLRQAPSGS
jgi:hypothetical protein